ncbi:MAG: hypothetical protein AB8H80_02860 [Planctomycetota bacterium]
MTDDEPDQVDFFGTERPPFGSWARVYALCCTLAVLVMALLYWFTMHFNMRMPG